MLGRIALLESMAEEIYREWFVRMRFPSAHDVVIHEKKSFADSASCHAVSICLIAISCQETCQLWPRLLSRAFTTSPRFSRQ